MLNYDAHFSKEFQLTGNIEFCCADMSRIFLLISTLDPETFVLTVISLCNIVY